MIKDLTVGKPGRVLWSYTYPMLISIVFQQLYNISDSIIAGKFAGEDALSAVGASYPVTMIFMAVAFGSNIGCSVVISQLFGAKKIVRMKTAIYTSLIASGVISALLTVVGIFASAPIMRLIRTPDNIFDDGNLYLRIYIAGFVFLFVYNICTSIFQALGDSKTPLWFLIGSSLGNIGLDILFVAAFAWGVAGVAWATFIAQGIACLLALAALIGRIRKIRTDEPVDHFSWWMLKKISRIAIPSILQQSFVSVGSIFIQGIINGYGSSVVAGYSAAIKLNTFAVTAFATLGNGISSFTAQNVGAKKSERIKSGLRAGVVITLITALGFILVLFLKSDVMIKLFMKEESVLATEAGRGFLHIVTPFYFTVSIKLICDGALRGMGRINLFMASTFTDLLLRVVLCFILPRFFELNGVWYSWPVGWGLSALLAVIFCVSVLRKKNTENMFLSV